MHIGLLIALFVCHYIGDYTHLSMPFMLTAKKIGKPLSPIFDHAGLHALLMWATMILLLPKSKWILVLCLCFLQLISHSIIDILKGRMNVWFPSIANPANKVYWYIFGLDQLLHALIIILMWYLTL